jgi:hypothetical protein
VSRKEKPDQAKKSDPISTNQTGSEADSRFQLAILNDRGMANNRNEEKLDCHA